MQVVLVHIQPFRLNSLLKCALQPKLQKNGQNPLFGDSKSFKIIDDNRLLSKKPDRRQCLLS